MKKMNKKAQVIEVAAILTIVAGLLKSKPFLIFIGMIILLFAVFGTSWMTGIPIWIFGLLILGIFIIFSRRR
jgi:hypothetical protein